MDAISYHKANRLDLQTLVDFRIEFLIELLGKQSSDSISKLRNFLENYFDAALTNNSYVCYMAKNENTVVGIGGMVVREQPGNFINPSGKVAYLLNMYTIPSYRRKGICSTILKALMKDANNSYVCYMAKNENTVVGIGGMVVREQPGNFINPSGKVAYLLNMYTIPSYRRKGICSTILKALMKDANESGIFAFELHATKEGEYAYRKDGFQMHSEPTYRKYIQNNM